MKDELVTIETAKLAKEKGFNWGEKCYFDINPNSQAMCYSETNPSHFLMPNQSLLQRWLREVHGVQIEVIPFYQDNICIGYNYCVHKTQEERIRYELDELTLPIHVDFTMYGDALEVALREALKITPQHLT